METIPANLKSLIFDKNAGEQLSADEQAIWDEWVEHINEPPKPIEIDLHDPALREALQLYPEVRADKKRLWGEFCKNVFGPDRVI